MAYTEILLDGGKKVQLHTESEAKDLTIADLEQIRTYLGLWIGALNTEARRKAAEVDAA